MLHLPASGMEHDGEAGDAAEFGESSIFQGPRRLAPQQIVEDGGLEFAEFR
jgi:hypothetical protein